jgi:hypothetical protein
LRVVIAPQGPNLTLAEHIFKGLGLMRDGANGRRGLALGGSCFGTRFVFLVPAEQTGQGSICIQRRAELAEPAEATTMTLTSHIRIGRYEILAAMRPRLSPAQTGGIGGGGSAKLQGVSQRGT